MYGIFEYLYAYIPLSYTHALLLILSPTHILHTYWSKFTFTIIELFPEDHDQIIFFLTFGELGAVTYFCSASFTFAKVVTPPRPTILCQFISVFIAYPLLR